MTSLRTQLNSALNDALRARQECKVNTIRLILAALKDRDIAGRTDGVDDGIPEDQIICMLQTMIKQRREAIELYEQGGRLDLAERERDEISVLQAFLPEQLDDGAIRDAVDCAISEVGANGLKDMGRTMAQLRQRYAGRMDFAKAGAMARAALQ